MDLLQIIEEVRENSTCSYDTDKSFTNRDEGAEMILKEMKMRICF